MQHSWGIAAQVIHTRCLFQHSICMVSIADSWDLAHNYLHFKSTFWTIPCCHNRKFKRRQLDMYAGAGTSVRIGKCDILQSDNWEASQNITLIWWTFNDQRMQLNHLIKRNVQKQLFISITFQMQPIILPIALKTIPHTFSAHYCPCRYLNTAISNHSKPSVL